mmetsp:Transcript_39532/g.114437  ORF Transcript_39532/g.114437 Transcript_39532/m.114437 type:complete len:222 (-) Transcript_39532:56-721(-)
MNRLAFSFLLASMMAMSSEGFTPTFPNSARKVPYFASVLENQVSSAQASTIVQEEAVPALDQKKKTKPTTTSAAEAKSKPAAGGHGKGGPLAPFVILAKKVLGEEELNQLRGKVIAEHSKVIGGFVDTSKTGFGETVLRMLFELADTNKNGTIEEEELAVALRKLGFDLKDNQIKGIFDRADKDENGAIDFEEWRKEAPSTLRTNLIKLAKRNGGDLGFLA